VRPALERLVDRVAADLPTDARRVVGIAGAPGSGKSTLASLLARRLLGRLGEDAVAVVPMDGFHLADVTLDALGLSERKGAPETFDADGYAALLRRLREPDERPVYAPGFERVLEQPLAAAVVVPPAARVVITEGNYLLLDPSEWVAVREALDEVWFCVTDDAVRRERLVARHVTFGKTPDEARAWVERVDDPNAALVEATRSRADLVIRVH
jgi:pantothenate kinase